MEKMRRIDLAQFGLFLAVVFTANTALSQTPDPRDYEVGYFVPSGTTIVNAYLRHQAGTHGSDYSADVAALRGTYLVKSGDFVLTPFDAILPIVDQTAYTGLGSSLQAFDPAFGMLPSDLKVSLHASGVGDMLFLPTLGYGLTQDAATHTHTWIALTTYLTIPTGQYDPNRLLNVGRNRWVLNPRLVVGQRFLGALTVEAMANVSFYGNNTQFRVPTPGLKGFDLALSQEASFGASLHAALDLNESFFVSAAYYVAMAGRSYFLLATPTGIQDNEVSSSTTVHTSRINLGIRLSRSTLVQVQWSEDLAGSSGAAMGRAFGLRLTHLFFSTPPRNKAAEAPEHTGA